MKTHMMDVLIAGAGPVGLTTALFCNKLGLRVAVADSKSSGVTHSYALALHPASLELLDEVGALAAVLERAVHVRRVAVYSGGERIAVVPVAMPGAKFPFIAVVGQDVIEATLARVLADRGVAVRWNLRLARFQQDPDLVSVDLDELEERVIGYAAARFDWMVKETHTLDTHFLVGADGHQSLVRRQMLIDFPEVKPPEHFAVFEFEGEDPLGDELVLVLHENGLGALWPLPDGRARWSFAVDPSRHPEALREKNHEPVQIIGPGAYPALEEAFFRRLLAERAPWFHAPIKHVYWRMLVRFERRLASSFGEGRVWLAGDSGHLTGPAGIQSMNVGMREARDLARALATSVQTGHPVPELASYKAQRREEWSHLLEPRVTVVPGAKVSPELVRHKEAIVSCLPASGPALADMAAELGLKIES